MSCILLWTVNPPPHWLRSAHDTVFFLSSSLIWLITLRQEAQDLEQVLPCPPLKLCNFAQNGTWTSTFINQHCLPREKCKYELRSRALFICTKEAIYWDFCTVNTWTRHQRSLSTFTFNFLELSNDTFNDSSFFNRPYFVPIITKEPVWFSSILFYCQLASYRWRTFVNSVNYKILRTTQLTRK